MHCIEVVARLALHDQSTDRAVIKYVDVRSLYPHVCMRKHYPVGHPWCFFIGPNLRGLDKLLQRIDQLYVSTTGVSTHSSLALSHKDKLMFVQCRACEHCLTGTWVSDRELQKAVAIGFVIVAIYEAWAYGETTVYDHATIYIYSEGGFCTVLETHEN